MRKRYSTLSWNTGPTGDHTSGSDTFTVVVIVVVDDILSYLTHYIFAVVLMTLHFVAIICIFTSINDHFLNLIISSYRIWLSPCISNTTSHIILVSCVLFNNGLMFVLSCKSKRRSFKC